MKIFFPEKYEKFSKLKSPFSKEEREEITKAFPMKKEKPVLYKFISFGRNIYVLASDYTDEHYRIKDFKIYKVKAPPDLKFKIKGAEMRFPSLEKKIDFRDRNLIFNYIYTRPKVKRL
jgi:hypothetical protein